MLDHVTGKCQLKKPVFITTSNGIFAQLFGARLNAKNSSNLLFVNIVAIRQEMEIGAGQTGKDFKGKIDSQVQLLKLKPDNFSETMSYKLENLEIMNTAGSVDKKVNIQKEFLISWRCACN